MSWLADNFSAIHLVLACAAMLYAKRYSPQWRVSAAYVAIYCAANVFAVWSTRNGADGGPEFYLWCTVFECLIIGLLIWKHPMSRWLAWTALFSIGMHVSAYLAYQVIPIIHPVLKFLQSVHNVTIPIVELSQVAGIFVFALPMFKGLDAEKKEHQVTWLAKTSTPHFR